MLITTFDSGEFTGWAQGVNGVLIACGLIVVRQNTAMSELPYSHCGKVWIEKPIHRRQGKTIDPNKLISLGIKVGRLQETYLVLTNEVQLIWPAEWKGGTPKKIQNERDRNTLMRSELDIVMSTFKHVAPSYQNNVWDAIGILLWAMKKEQERK